MSMSMVREALVESVTNDLHPVNLAIKYESIVESIRFSFFSTSEFYRIHFIF